MKYITNILKKSTLLLSLIAVSGGAYALDVPAGTYYFDNTKTQWSEVYLRIGKSDYTTSYKMSKVSGNANIYSYNVPSDWTGAEAFQFVAVSGYSGSNVSIYEGNNISSGQKSEYVKSTGNFLYIPTTNTTGYYSLDKTNAPAALGTSFITINSTEYNGSGIGKAGGAFNNASLGVFAPESKITIKGEATASGTNASSKVSGTLDYCVSGYNTSTKSGTFAMLNLPYNTTTNAKKVNSTGVSVTLPKTAGDYKLATYFKCVGVFDSNSGNNYVANYTIAGFTAYGANFGSILKNMVKSSEIEITNVYGNNVGEGKLSAAISGTDATQFSFEEASDVNSASIDITDHAGTLTVYFRPSTEGSKTATLTITLTYNTDQTIVQTYSLIGYAQNGNPVCHIGDEPTFAPVRQATLNGYLQYRGCNSGIRERGFVYTSASGTPTVPTASSSAWAATNATEDMASGDKWSVTTGTLTASRTYKYRAYVIYNSTKYLSAEIGTFTTGASDCVYQFGDTVYVTVDNSLAADDECALKYKNIENAIAKIKSSDISNSKQILKYNVVMLVVPTGTKYTGTKMLGDSTGGYRTSPINLPSVLFRNINDPTDSSTPEKWLIVRSANPAVRPEIQHPIIRKSRNIIFDNVQILGSEVAASGQYDNAIDIDNASHDWHLLPSGGYPSSSVKANIIIRNSYIMSHGFTCIHVSAYNGVTLENNDIEAKLPASELSNSNTVYWGSSVKMIQCRNFSFLRNNFRGSHATSMWVQGVIGGLFMNNVFWNSNNSYVSSYRNNGAVVRLVTQYKTGDGRTESQYNYNKNLGFYYNTFYIASNGAQTTDTRYFDFFRLGSNYGSDLKNNLDLNEESSIRFMYNNCYSYDETMVLGANRTDATTLGTANNWCLDEDESDWCPVVDFNNFWSMYDENNNRTASVFGIPNGCDASTYKQYYINVKELLCSTGAEDPSSLIMKGGDLNLGVALTSTTDVSGLHAYEIYNDRLHASNGNDAVRNVNGKWTLGAYQQSDPAAPLATLIWWGGATGAETDWDNRNNWRKEDGTRVTCIDNIAEDVTVVIPSPTSSKYKLPDGGIKYYPVIPNKFSGDRTKLSQETVNAGQGILPKPSKFAGTIEIEYGGALKNVGSLYDDDGRHYDEASNHFTAGRSEWILVGTVVKPFENESKNSVRFIQSGDYYLNKEPHVYMRWAELSGSTASWQTPFAQLDEKVSSDKVFAIKIPDQYGPYKRKAIRYYGDATDATVPKTFNFNGWFLNDEQAPEYKVTSANMLLCNTLPANIKAKAAGTANGGSIKYYDYSKQDFQLADDDEAEVKSQNGFIFVASGSLGDNRYFRITKELLSDNNTKYKSAEVVNPFIKIEVSNPNGTDGTSGFKLIYDELASDSYKEGIDFTNTSIAGMPTKPEVYVMLYDKELDYVTVPALDKVIPLGLNVETPMTVNFTIEKMYGIEKAVLEDRATGQSYDLLKGETGSIELAKGTYTGRFYLNLGVEDEDVPTHVDESDEYSGSGNIDIYSSTGSKITIYSSQNVELEKAYISDMSGRTTVIDLKDPHFNTFTIKGADGVYIVKAVAKNMSRVEKVILK